jgi:hypothetical protein
MSCCGNSGGTLNITTRDIEEGLRLQLEYAGGRTVHVTGPVTGATYTFSGMSRVQPVDPRDAMGILRDRQFRLKGVVRDGTSGSQAR